LAAPPPETVIEDLYQLVHVRALVLPISPSLPSAERAQLQSRARTAIAALVGDAGIGETLVYNRLVAAVMQLEGVLDVALELYGKPLPGEAPGPRFQNFSPAKTLRPKLADDDLIVEIASEIVAFDVVATIELTDFATATGTLADNLADARAEVAGLLQDRIASVAAPITPASLLAKVPPTISYSVTSLTYTVQYLEAGLQVNEPNPSITLGELERPWVRRVALTEASG
jgi:hypothetical protein